MTRVLAFLFGSVVYCVFLVTWLLAIAFLANFSVFGFKTIDTGPQVPLGHAITVNALLLLLWTVPHSVMARQRFKSWWIKIVPPPVERSMYVLTASLLLLLLLHQWKSIPSVVWSIENDLGYFVLTALFWVGWLLVFYATFLIDHFDMFGLRQVYDCLRRKEYTPPGFKNPSLHKYVRHPIMTSLIIAFWATPRMTVGHLVFSTGMTIYILVGTMLEEKDLTAMFGDTYRDYRRRVPMILPLPRKRRAGPATQDTSW